jgi:hypothetical protein
MGKTKQVTAEIDGSVEQWLESVRTAFREAFSADSWEPWVSDVFETHVIARDGDQHFRVAMASTDEGITFAAPTDWEPVKLSYVREMHARGYTVGEFRGSFPAVATHHQVDIQVLTRGDEDPFFVVLPIARVGEVSTNGLEYDETLVSAIAEQVVGKGGLMGHLKEEERPTAFPIESVDWVGAAREGETLWAKGYLPPGEAREYVRRLMARGGKLATSIYGTYDEEVPGGKGGHQLRGFQLETLDLAPPDRAALSLGGAFQVTGEMEIQPKQEEDIMDKAQVLAELTAGDAKDLPKTVREAIIKDWQSQNDEAARIAEIEGQIQEKDKKIAELEQVMGEARREQFQGDLEKLIAETVKHDSLRPVARRAVLAEIGGEADLEKARTALETYAGSEEYKTLAQAIVSHKAGPSAIVGGGQKRQAREIDDSPEARREARRLLGI